MSWDSEPLRRPATAYAQTLAFMHKTEIMKLDDKIKPEDRLGTEYKNHLVFKLLENLSDFYESLSYTIMGFSTTGTLSIINLDTYAYSSIKGTIESINDTLRKGRINDSYALLRKFFDSTIINIYTNLYLIDNIAIDNFIVSKIENWRKGTERIPDYRVMSQYIKKSDRLKGITNLLQKDERYKKIRDRCNAHTHYNFYKYYLLNDNEIYNENRIKYLDIFAFDIESIFIQHFSYLFSIHEHYMASTDYIDSKDLGIEPEEDSQYWVASFIQETFDNLIKLKRPDIAEFIKTHTIMHLK